MGWVCLEEKGRLLGHQDSTRKRWIGEVVWLVREAGGAGDLGPVLEAGCLSAAVQLCWFEPVVVWGSDWWVSN